MPEMHPSPSWLRHPLAGVAAGAAAVAVVSGAVAIFEQPDAAERDFGRIRVVAHLDNIEPAIFIVSGCDGTCYVRFVRDELHAQAIERVKRF